MGRRTISRGSNNFFPHNIYLYITLLSCYKLNRCYIKLSVVNSLENVFVFKEILFKILLFKGGVLIYAEHYIYIYIYIYTVYMFVCVSIYMCVCVYIYMCVCVCVCVCIYIYMCVCVCVCVCVYIYIYVCVYIYICVCVYILVVGRYRR